MLPLYFFYLRTKNSGTAELFQEQTVEEDLFLLKKDENGKTETKTALLGWMRSNLYFIDAETGKAEDVLAFQSDIVSIQSRTDSEDSIFVALYDGKVMQVTTGETIGKRKAYEVDNELDGFSYTSDKKLMGEFVIKPWMKILAWICSVLLIILNFWLIISTLL